MTIGACFNCCEKGHFTATCLRKMTRQDQEQGNGQPPRVQGRIFAMTENEAETSTNVVKGNNNVAK